MGNEMKVTKRSMILSVEKPYDFPNEQGEQVRGCAMHFIAMSDIDELNNKTYDEETGACGLVPTKKTMDPSFYDVAKEVQLPCFADITYSIKLTSKKVKAEITDIVFVRDKK